uniref:Endonuclease/exonuclease/phosphatase domain-containing protein n=1 Tax=Panagrolaimus sp. PS1159 TaxID=55785 RepID=A0AC35F653_9BILA
MFFTSNSDGESNVSKIENFVEKNSDSLRILTFNTWFFGEKVENGLDKIVKHIKILNPDIVALQEVQTAEMFQEFLKKLGSEWNSVISSDEYPDNAILTKHSINATTLTIAKCNKFLGVKIHIKNSTKAISFWGMHLDQYSFGPYAGQNRLVTKMEQILSGETNKNKTGRVDNIKELLETKEFVEAIKESNEIPVIVAGDFNTPSHLDWISENKESHGGWIIQWPATFLLQTKTGLIDSFREIYPNPIEYPGFTWTTVNRYPEWDYSIPEAKDRIDFILYKSPLLKPINSFIYSGNEMLKEVPNQQSNDYPSDHFSLITDFV